MNEEKYTEKLIIPSYLTDSNRVLSPASFLALTQEMAYKGAEQLNIGDSTMSAKGLAWVFSKARFITSRSPEISEHVILETWHKCIIGPCFIRDFRMLSNEGEELVKATCSCVLIDMNSRMLMRPDHVEECDCLEPQCADSTFQDQADRIIIPHSEPCIGSVEHEIMYTDIDFVGHTNNTNYLKWAMDCEAMNGGNLHPRDVTVNFLHETSAGEHITFRRVLSSGISFLVGEVCGRPVMTARLAGCI